jgi:hypothetical protein
MTIGSLDIFPQSSGANNNINSLTGYPLTVPHGGTGVTSLGLGVLLGNGTNPIISQPLTNGQVLIGSTGLNPVATTITSGAGITINTGPGTITISATGVAAGFYTTDAGTTTSSPSGNLNVQGLPGGPIQTSVGVNTIYSGLTQTIGPPSGGTGVSSPPAHTLPVAEGAAPWNFLGPLTNGQILIGQTGADPIPANLTAGTGISISNTTGMITINSVGGGVHWVDQTSAPIAPMVSNTGYVSDSASLITFQLPTAPAFGDVIRIAGKGSGGWKIIQNAGQNIQLGEISTTPTTGGLASTNQYDVVELLCITSPTTFSVLSSIGNITIS